MRLANLSCLRCSVLAAISLLAASTWAGAQDFPVPTHWADGLPCDDVWVMPDPLGLDAHRIAAAFTGPATASVVVEPMVGDAPPSVEPGHDAAPGGVDRPPAEIRTGPPVASAHVDPAHLE